MIDDITVSGDPARLWEAEYGRKGIPSSFRLEPSGSLASSLQLLDAAGFRGTTAADVGCGTGRNSMYLAVLGYEVYAMDIAAAVLNQFQQTATAAGLAERIHVSCQSVAQPWPIASNACDFVVDTFCFKHIIPSAAQEAYLSELVRVIRPGGYFVLTLAGKDDGYYGIQPQAADAPQRVIIDPANGIASVLYDQQEIVDRLSPWFELFHYEHKLKTGQMHGAAYLRSTHCFIMKRIAQT